MIPKPNVQITIKRNGRTTVHVDGKLMPGVLGVELIQPSIEQRGPDGWTMRKKDGPPVWHIKVSSRFVNAGPEED